MKTKIILTLILLTVLNTAKAQDKNYSKLKSLKIGYITQVLNLKPEEAQVFWPIYNKHQDSIIFLRKNESRNLMNKVKEANGVKNLSEAEADKILSQFLVLENKIQSEKNEMYNELKGVISSKKLLKLHRAENDFNRKILQRLRKEKAKQNRKE